MPSDDLKSIFDGMDDLFGANPFKSSSTSTTSSTSSFTSTSKTQVAPKGQKVRIKLNNHQFRKLRSGEELEYKVGENTVLLVLPADVRDAVERTS